MAHICWWQTATGSGPASALDSFQMKLMLKKLLNTSSMNRIFQANEAVSPVVSNICSVSIFHGCLADHLLTLRALLVGGSHWKIGEKRLHSFSINLTSSDQRSFSIKSSAGRCFSLSSRCFNTLLYAIWGCSFDLSGRHENFIKFSESPLLF